jgi:hypothetical protein
MAMNRMKTADWGEPSKGPYANGRNWDETSKGPYKNGELG